ncbi:pantetheine-phosphate adenylyltransferase [Mycoplasmopsis cricetuli]|uniref:pantetheine-phosphate adenylyltransferase n=1 Tax=Mycoplasmopsis cricetuli TaxID=171283 RepID=UPI00046FFA7D|nr:pantetheine-phosphate adenylyltransferase [Mycoplasmopsis cricetuli]
MKSKIAIYPGSFDPIHKGHIEILKKALNLFDKIYVIVSVNPDKLHQNDIQIRYQLVKEKTKQFKNIEILINENELTALVARKLKANFIIRSARNILDYNYEIELAAGNKHLNKNLETILIMPNYQHINYSSTLMRHKKRLNK